MIIINKGNKIVDSNLESFVKQYSQVFNISVRFNYQVPLNILKSFLSERTRILNVHQIQNVYKIYGTQKSLLLSTLWEFTRKYQLNILDFDFSKPSFTSLFHMLYINDTYDQDNSKINLEEIEPNLKNEIKVLLTRFKAEVVFQYLVEKGAEPTVAAKLIKEMKFK